MTANGTVHGGRNIYGVPLGILMLRTRFPRIPGDAGNAQTWPYPVHYRIVEGTDVESIVRNLDPARFLEPFISAALQLEADGVSAITTNCGFLVVFQDALQSAVRVPVATSSLLQVPWVHSLLPPGKRVGILTFEGPSLGEAHLRAAKIDPVTVAIAGLEGSAFHETILHDLDTLDVDAARTAHVDAARALIESCPDVGAIVLECTNMPPYAQAIRLATGLPVYDLTTLVGWWLGATSGHRGAF